MNRALTVGIVLCAISASISGQSTSLGATTRKPSKEEIGQHGLEIKVRVLGQVVQDLVKDGPAEAAGIKTGDFILQIDDNKIYSWDDIHDFLRVSKPGQKVRLLLLRQENSKEEKVTVKLGGKKAPARRGDKKKRKGEEKARVAEKPHLTWHFAGLGQLPQALARAKKEQKLLFIGLSGAET